MVRKKLREKSEKRTYTILKTNVYRKDTDKKHQQHRYQSIHSIEVAWDIKIKLITV